jgi:TIR domain
MTENGGAPVGYSAFISHASDEAEIASKVCSQLESTGFRCWIAPRDVRPGQDYPEEIIRGIEQSKCLVLILSQKANNSKFVRSEVERAYSKGKPVFPVRIEEVLPSRALELFISTKHWIDAWHGDLSDHAASLANEIAQHADLDAELPAAFRRKIRIKNLARAGGTVIAALIIAIVVGLVMRSNPSTSSVPPLSSR